MNETPKCPYCGNDMIYHFNSEIIDMKKVIYQGYFACKNCHSRAPVVSDLSGLDSLDPIKNEAYLIATERFEPENRVLALDEVLRKICADDLEFSWIEFAKGTHTNIYHLNQFILEDENPEDKTIDLFFFGIQDSWQREKESDYGKTWRCWLHKPTEEEMEKETWVK